VVVLDHEKNQDTQSPKDTQTPSPPGISAASPSPEAPMSTEDFFLLNKKEELHPVLAAFVEQFSMGGQMLRHPLVFSVPYYEQMNAYLNQQYRQKLKAIQEAREQREFFRYVHLHEKPYRLYGFLQIEEELSDQQYWSILGDVWTNIENISEDIQHWRRLWRSKRPNRSVAMDEDEREIFDTLPERLTIYRGSANRRGVRSMSWSRQPERAHWFGRRSAGFVHADYYYLATCEVRKEDVLAYFSREDEIVLFPAKCVNLQIQKVGL
jgi:hypothetical protein